MEAPDFVYKIYPCEPQLLFDILLLISAGTGILQALDNLPKLFGVLIMVSGYSTWQKGAPTHKTGCWALLRCQTPRCKVALCEDSKEPLLLPLINSRKTKAFAASFQQVYYASWAEHQHQSRGKCSAGSASTHAFCYREAWERASSFSEGFCSFVHPFTDPLHCSGHRIGCWSSKQNN